MATFSWFPIVARMVVEIPLVDGAPHVDPIEQLDDAETDVGQFVGDAVRVRTVPAALRVLPTNGAVRGKRPQCLHERPATYPEHRAQATKRQRRASQGVDYLDRVLVEDQPHEGRFVVRTIEHNPAV